MKFPRPEQHVLPDKIKCSSPRSTVSIDKNISNRIIGSMMGLALGDALGASVEFRPREYFIKNPVNDMNGGGTWGLRTGQWTDDTSMALCLASSLISKNGYDPYDQMVRYKWWYQHGYMSSTGSCFDIGNATLDSLQTFIHRQTILSKRFRCSYDDEIDSLSWDEIQKINEFDINCSEQGVAGNGALMRLAPVPLFFYKYPSIAIEYAGRSGRLTHGDTKAVDACRYYAALIVAAVNGHSKTQILDNNFYKTNRSWFGSTELHKDIIKIAEGSYKRKNGYQDGIRGKGYIVSALEAALWAFWSDEGSFAKGALAAVNLGDDTDTTAAIYGQLAGAFYGYNNLPEKWIKQIYAKDLIYCIGEWIYFLGTTYKPSPQEYNMSSSNKSKHLENNPSSTSNYDESRYYKEPYDHLVDPNLQSAYDTNSNTSSRRYRQSQERFNHADIDQQKQSEQSYISKISYQPHDQDRYRNRGYDRSSIADIHDRDHSRGSRYVHSNEPTAYDQNIRQNISSTVSNNDRIPTRELQMRQYSPDNYDNYPSKTYRNDTITTGGINSNYYHDQHQNQTRSIPVHFFDNNPINNTYINGRRTFRHDNSVGQSNIQTDSGYPATNQHYSTSRNLFTRIPYRRK